MELQQLRAFLAVAEELHFGRAAERLFMAQPPLSRVIQQLEKEVGARLFDRTTRSVRLTPAGEVLVGPAREIMDRVRSARSAVKGVGLGLSGRVRVGYAGPSSHTLIARLAWLVRQERPGIELSLQSTTYANEALGRVIEGSMDVAIARWELAPPGIASRVVRVEQPVVVVAAAHRLAGGSGVAMADLSGEPFVTLPAHPGSLIRDVLLRSCYEAGFAPDIVQAAPDSWTVMALVAAGVGVTLTLDSALEHIPHTGIAVLPVNGDFPPVYARLAWRANDDSPALHEVLRVSEAALPTPPQT
jgi:DNA-binding transcriptional LysR family regulator